MRDSLGKYIAVIYRYQQILINNELKPYGIGSGQYFFLINIKENQGISQQELTNLIRIDKATTAKALKKLEDIGYIYRVSDDNDRRCNKLYLTLKGLEFMPKLENILKVTSKKFIKDIDEEEYYETIDILKKVFNNAQSEVDLLKVERDLHM